MDHVTKQSRGGSRRAEVLSPERRHQISSDAAKTRWANEVDIPRATHRGVLTIGDAHIPCAVLENGQRVISEHGITGALGSRSGASKRRKKAASETGKNLPIFVAPSNLRPFIREEEISGVLNPTRYKDGRRVVVAYDAAALPVICEIWLRARDAKALQLQQQDRANQAESLMRALAHVAIVALVDEVTGYQDDRERDALHKLLSRYLSEERLAWAKMFPDEYYRQLYRLRSWEWPAGGGRTPLLGKITNAIVYERLPPGVLDELRGKNPIVDATKRRKWKHHQFLSEDFGQQDLKNHLLQLIAIMKISKNWRQFERNVEIAFPKQGAQLDRELDEKQNWR